ncbi:MAG: glycosyltransferase, partial [Thermoproteus sp.]
MRVALISYFDAERGGGARRALYAYRLYRYAGLEAIPAAPLSRGLGALCGADAYLSYHEGYDTLLKALLAGARCGARKVALLQGSPFYKDPRRRRNLLAALSIFENYARKHSMEEHFRRYLAARRAVILRPPSLFGEIFKLFDLVIHISPSIPAETGVEGYVMDPGASLPRRELRILASRKPRKNCVLYVGRPVPEKGIVEAVLIFAKAASRTPLRLCIATPGGPGARLALAAARDLGVGDRVTHVELSRPELLSAYSEAKAVVYPSHD